MLLRTACIAYICMAYPLVHGMHTTGFQSLSTTHAATVTSCSPQPVLQRYPSCFSDQGSHTLDLYIRRLRQSLTRLSRQSSIWVGLTLTLAGVIRPYSRMIQDNIHTSYAIAYMYGSMICGIVSLFTGINSYLGLRMIYDIRQALKHLETLKCFLATTAKKRRESASRVHNHTHKKAYAQLFTWHTELCASRNASLRSLLNHCAELPALLNEIRSE